MFLFYINSGKIARSFFYFIFKIFPKMQHFYAHFPPFLYQFCIKKRENLFCRFSLFLYFYSVFFTGFILKNGLSPHRMIIFFVSIPPGWYIPPQGTPKGAGKPEVPPPEAEAGRCGVPRSRFFQGHILSDTSGTLRR